MPAPAQVVVQLGDDDAPERAADELGLDTAPLAIALVGGADSMDEDALASMRPLVETVLVPLVGSRAGVVVDGGTDSGVMRLIGRARAATGAHFPLVGVVPAALVAEGSATLEPNHTHIVLVPGVSWGDEGPWLAGIAGALAERSLTVLVNGGDVAWDDVAESVDAGRPVIALEGSGRAADALAAAVRGTDAEPRAAALVASGLVHASSADRDSFLSLVDRLAPEP